MDQAVPPSRPIARLSLLCMALMLCAPPSAAQGRRVKPQKLYPDMPEGRPAAREVENATAASAAEMKVYVEPIPGSEASFGMLPIAAGTFSMGSPETEADRKKAEGPVHEVSVGAFWMGKCEVTWDEYHVFMFKRDIELRKTGDAETTPQDAWADAVSRPTPPYVPMNFEMGVEGYPAICMTQFAAMQYTKWLSLKTGRFYRLPTEAEWEYACRAGTTTAYSFGADTEAIDDYAWHFDNADDEYQPVGKKKPNPWGLHDMHGNVSEWVLDSYTKTGYSIDADGKLIANPLVWPSELYPRCVRGGSWDDDPDRLRSAARRGSSKGWKVQDPQLPKSIWYHTDARWLGFRVVRPLEPPSVEEQARFWGPDLERVREIMEKQRKGGR